MPQPLIDIVLPTFNRAHLIATSIDSVLAQDYQNWELIIVNDNSADTTDDVVHAYQARDPRIRYVSNDRYRHCCGGARARGVDEVRADFVAFLDSDDMWLPGHLSSMMARLQANPDVDLVFGDFARVHTSGKVLVASKIQQEWPGRVHFATEQRGDLFVLSSDQFVENALRYDLPANLQSSLVRASVFQKVRIRDIFGCEDSLFNFEAAAAGFRYAYVLEPHLRYLVHDSNVSGSNQSGSIATKMKIADAIVAQMREYLPAYIPMTPERRAILRSNLADYYVWTIANGVLRPAGHRLAAIKYVLKGIALQPWRAPYWKTLIGTAF